MPVVPRVLSWTPGSRRGRPGRGMSASSYSIDFLTLGRLIRERVDPRSPHPLPVVLVVAPGPGPNDVVTSLWDLDFYYVQCSVAVRGPPLGRSRRPAGSRVGVGTEPVFWGGAGPSPGGPGCGGSEGLPSRLRTGFVDVPVVSDSGLRSPPRRVLSGWKGPAPRGRGVRRGGPVSEWGAGGSVGREGEKSRQRRRGKVGRDAGFRP